MPGCACEVAPTPGVSLPEAKWTSWDVPPSRSRSAHISLTRCSVAGAGGRPFAVAAATGPRQPDARYRQSSQGNRQVSHTVSHTVSHQTGGACPLVELQVRHGISEPFYNAMTRRRIKHARSSWMPPCIWEPRPPVVPADTGQVARWPEGRRREAPWLSPWAVSRESWSMPLTDSFDPSRSLTSLQRRASGVVNCQWMEQWPALRSASQAAARTSP